MSGHERVAAVTFVLSQLLQRVASNAVSGATVTTGRPDTTENGASEPRINLFLFGAPQNGAWRNADLPTRRPDTTLVQRPQVALDLQYLLSFYGEESTLDSQRLLGRIVSLLHAQPLLSRQRIQETINAVANPAIGGDPTHFLADSDLAEQVDIVRFSPMSLNLEELSKLWSVFFQVPYALSVAYQASVVLIEADETPRRALPVRRPEIIVRPFRRIVIDRIISQDGADQPIHADSTLLVLGQQLRGEHTEVRIAGQVVPPEGLDVSNTQIRVPLAAIAASLRAGVQGLQVVHLLSTGRPHLRFESNVAPFVLRPRIDGDSLSFEPVDESDEPEVGMNVEPAVRASQRVILLLNERTNEAPNAYVFEESSEADSNQISIRVPGVEPGAYLVRIQVDGAESILEVDEDPGSPTFEQYIGPTVTVP